MRARVAAAFVGLALVAGAAQAGIVVGYEEAMTRYRDGLRTVVVCEEDGKDNERWRVLEFELWAQSFLYVDRLRVNPKDATWHSVESFEFAAINDDHVGTELHDLECARDGDGVRVEGWARSGHEPCEWTIAAIVRPGRKPEWSESDPACDVGEAE